jgi:hypothetical protein
MSNARWDRIQDLYHAALERPASARAAFLREACEGDSALLHEVQSLHCQVVRANRRQALSGLVTTTNGRVGRDLTLRQLTPS